MVIKMDNENMETWRLIDSGVVDPAYTMAVDEALLLSKFQAKTDLLLPKATLHLYSRDPPAVSLGYFQKAGDEIHLDLCEKLGVKVLRRGSGGGAVYTDRNQVIYGLVISGDSMGTISESFGTISRGVIETLKLFDLSAELTGLNDITIDGKKISGCAQTRKNNIILQHGTFLIDLDRNLVTDILTPSRLKFQDKSADDLNGRITCLSSLLGYSPTLDELKQKIIMGFETAFKVRIEKGELTVDEKALVEDLLGRKYHNNEWNFRR
jgi:lipoate-protein ligase A